jgi:hypothetical protein
MISNAIKHLKKHILYMGDKVIRLARRQDTMPNLTSCSVDTAADHSPKSSAECKNNRSCTSTPPDYFLVYTSKTCNLITEGTD